MGVPWLWSGGGLFTGFLGVVAAFRRETRLVAELRELLVEVLDGLRLLPQQLVDELLPAGLDRLLFGEKLIDFGGVGHGIDHRMNELKGDSPALAVEGSRDRVGLIFFLTYYRHLFRVG